MATRAAQKDKAREVALRLASGDKVNDLVEEFGVSRMTLWRWNNQATADAMPHMDDRDEWREELTAVLTDAIVTASTKGDDRALVPLIDRLAKLNGLDHTHRLAEAHLQLDAVRVRLLAEKLGTALNAANIPPDMQIRVLEQLRDADDG